jgi:hypothetical protein
MRLYLAIAMLIASAGTAFAHGMSEADKQRILEAGLLEALSH